MLSITPRGLKAFTAPIHRLQLLYFLAPRFNFSRRHYLKTAGCFTLYHSIRSTCFLNR